MLLIFFTLFVVFSVLSIAVVFIISDRYETGIEKMLQSSTDALERYHDEVAAKYENTRYGKIGLLYEQSLTKTTK